MSDRERLHEIIDTLPPHQIQALLTLLQREQSLSDEDFARHLAGLPEDDTDEETVTRVLAAEAEAGETITSAELKRHLGL